MAAHSRAAKRKRLGRKLVHGPRHECGRLVQPTGEERETAARDTAIKARMRIYHVSGDEAQNPLRGYALGRLYLKGHINQKHLDAGEKFERDYQRYYRLLRIPSPSPRAQDVTRLGGEGVQFDPDDIRQAAAAFIALEGVLGGADTAGRPVTTVTKRVCLQDEDIVYPHMIGFLKKGLDALAIYYGLEKKS